MAHLDALAKQPRPAGSAAAASARDYCAEQLRALGFTVAMRPFEYSALPGRYGAPIIGGTAAILVIVVIATTLGGHERSTNLAVATLLVWGVVVATLGLEVGTIGVEGCAAGCWFVLDVEVEEEPLLVDGLAVCCVAAGVLWLA